MTIGGGAACDGSRQGWQEVTLATVGMSGLVGQRDSWITRSASWLSGPFVGNNSARSAADLLGDISRRGVSIMSYRGGDLDLRTPQAHSGAERETFEPPLNGTR